MNDNIFNKFREIIYKNSGIYFTESKKYLLENRIAKRVQAKNFQTYEQYLDFIESPYKKYELIHLFESVTINETYFFRSKEQFEVFEKLIVPEIISNKTKIINNTIFRIWSAASSSGEEAYTLAMIINDKFKPLYPHVQFQVLASDISQQIIETAKNGIYNDYAVRNVPINYLKKYFLYNGKNYIIIDEIKKMVRFANINLNDSAIMQSMRNCDLIFCSNVLIYFDLETKKKVITYLYNSLNKGGYLFVGYSESLLGVSSDFKLIHFPKAMAYKKEK